MTSMCVRAFLALSPRRQAAVRIERKGSPHTAQATPLERCNFTNRRGRKRSLFTRVL
jgi:hypothetical protein